MNFIQKNVNMSLRKYFFNNEGESLDDRGSSFILFKFTLTVGMIGIII